MTKIEVTNALRAEYLERISALFAESTDVLQTAAGTIMMPVVDADGNDRWVKVSVIIPKAGDGDDGYDLAEEYRLKLEATAERKAQREREAAEKKAKADAKKAKKAQENE